MLLSVYTSCSINYLAKARVLADSLKRCHPDAKITLLLNDVVPSWLDLAAEPFDRIWQPKDLGYDLAWVFQHNVMELCTAVKGRALVRLMEIDQAELYLYFDPDVYVYRPLDPLVDYMGDAEIGLVPHITKPEDTEIGIQLTELSVMAHGTYNLGHLVIRDGSHARAFAQWWADRLDRFCFDDKDYGLFTDQRWCDAVPALFDKVQILRQPNIDLASWNVNGRMISQTRDAGDACFIVDGYPLLTYHFSGTGPGGKHRWVREIFAPTNGALAEIELRYEAAIEARQQSKLENWTPGFDFFDTGVPIPAKVRQLYRKHADLQAHFPDPYRVNNQSCFLKWLRTNWPELVRGLYLSAQQIDRAFVDLFDTEFYLRRYALARRDVRELGRFETALDHYIHVGSRLLFDPNPYFVSGYYYETAQKLEGASLRQFASPQKEHTLLWHYLTIGLPNGVEPVEKFDSNWYLSTYPDVLSVYSDGSLSCPLTHFVTFGDKEHRMPSKTFSPTAVAARKDIQRAIELGWRLVHLAHLSRWAACEGLLTIVCGSNVRPRFKSLNFGCLHSSDIIPEHAKARATETPRIFCKLWLAVVLKSISQEPIRSEAQGQGFDAIHKFTFRHHVRAAGKFEIVSEIQPHRVDLSSRRPQNLDDLVKLARSKQCAKIKMLDCWGTAIETPEGGDDRVRAVLMP